MSIGQDLDRCVPLPLPAEVLVCACPVHFFPWHEHVVLSKLKPVFFCRHWFYVRFVSFTHTPSLGDSIGLRATGRGSWKPMCKIHYLYPASWSLRFKLYRKIAQHMHFLFNSRYFIMILTTVCGELAMTYFLRIFTNAAFVWNTPMW